MATDDKASGDLLILFERNHPEMAQRAGGHCLFEHWRRHKAAV
jgi:hypothetical protein